MEGTFLPPGVARSEIEIEMGSGTGTGMEVRIEEIDVSDVKEEATAIEATRPPILAATLTLAEPETL